MNGDPLAGLELSTDSSSALELAADRVRNRPLGTFDVLVALIAVDSLGLWNTVQLRASFVSRGDRLRHLDRAQTPDGRWRDCPLTADLTAALRNAAALASEYDLVPVPPGALALGLLSDPGSGASRALLEDSVLEHGELVELVQDELLDTRLEGLTPGAEPSSVPSAVDETPQIAPTRPRGGSGDQSVRPDAPEPLRSEIEDAEVVAQPSDVTDPWVLVSADRVITLHDLRGLDDHERRQIRAKASVGLSLGELPGVVPTLSVADHGDWIAIHTPRLGRTLDEHLDEARRGHEFRLAPEVYADGLARVADALQRLHDHGIAHREVRPANLLVDDSTGSWAIRTHGAGEPAVSDERYKAPEQLAGEVGPSVDQYALGVITRTVYFAAGAAPLTTPVFDVLQRATAPRPADRFSTIAEFGAAVRSAVRTEAPSGLADRLARVGRPGRAAFTPALIAAAVGLGFAIEDARTQTSPMLTVLVSVMTVGVLPLIAFMAVMWAGAIRGKRTFLSIPFVNRPLVPFAGYLGGAAIAHLSSGESLLSPGVAFWPIVYAYGGRSLLAPAPADGGRWLISLARRWDRRRALPPLRRLALPAALSTIALAVLAVPVASMYMWPEDPFPTDSARDYGPLITVWNLRNALGARNLSYPCEHALALPPPPRRAPCRDLARIASAVQRSDPVTKSGNAAVFGARGTIDTFRVQEIPAPKGVRVWNILAPKTRRDAGVMYTEGQSGRRMIVMISREPPPRVGMGRSHWLYQLALTRDEWRITGFRACTIDRPGAGKKPAKCTFTDTTAPAVVRRILEMGKARQR